MGYFDKYNKKREEGTNQAPARNATWRNAEQAIYDAVQYQRRLAEQWSSYVTTQQHQEQEAQELALTRGRGNRFYLWENYGTGSYTQGKQAITAQPENLNGTAKRIISPYNLAPGEYVFQEAAGGNGLPHSRAKRISAGSATAIKGRELFLTDQALQRKHFKEATENAEELAGMDQRAEEEWIKYLHQNSGGVNSSPYDPRIDPAEEEEYHHAQGEHALIHNQYQAGIISQEEYNEKATVLSDYMEAFYGNAEHLDFLEDPRIPQKDRDDYITAYQEFQNVYRQYQAGSISYTQYTNETEGVWKRIWNFYDKCSEITEEEAAENLQLVDSIGHPIKISRGWSNG